MAQKHCWVYITSGSGFVASVAAEHVQARTTDDHEPHAVVFARVVSHAVTC